ncbi:MAG: ATP-binding protein [Dehalococcoidales bacterium]|nr:ATP-binding protein [Dehalococcoidales bacterium]
MTERLGIVVSASLEGGVVVRLEPGVSVEEMVVGRYVAIQGQRHRFFGMITDVRLEMTDERLASAPPEAGEPLLASVVSGVNTYGIIRVTPMLTIGGDAVTILEGPQPVKTIPAHFSPVELASERDMELVFGQENERNFHIGNPLDMETKLCLNLEEFVKRSNGIFGKSGTGKTFLTRILLIGMLQKSRAVNLIFDMHNEYGWQGTNEAGPPVKGLKQLFPAAVAVYTLDEENSVRRGVKVDSVVKIGYDEIEPDDIALLRQTLNLTELAVEASYQLRRRFGRQWIQRTLELEDAEEVRGLLEETKIHESTFQSLRRGLNTIRRLPFITSHAAEDIVPKILAHLDRGVNVVLEFGRYREIAAYVLVANMLARRIYAHYQAQTEKAMAEGSSPPRPLVITIEEAHRFLNPEIAAQTIFGTIAREMRKYNVTLLVIDQRPSGISEEVMSQLGTKITCLLDNERDIDSVLAGVSGKSELKTVLARLAPKRQALIFGHAVPMPVAFQPVSYDADFYARLAGRKAAGKTEDLEKFW